MNNFSIMAAQLMRDTSAPAIQLLADLHDTKAASIRALLREGPMTSRDITVALGLARPALVGALLKHDMAIGRVVRQGNCYALSQGWDEAEQEAVAAAIRLLRRHGHSVRRATA